MKRLFLLLITSALVLCFVGCSNSPAESSTPSTSPTASFTTKSYTIGNLAFELSKDTDVSVKSSANSSLYSFPVVSGQSSLLVSVGDVSRLSIATLDGFVIFTQKTLTGDYNKIGSSDINMDIAGFPASGEVFYVQEDGKLYNYNVMSFTDTYYVYTFIYMTLTGVSDSVECTLAYGDLIGNLEYTGPSPRK